MSAQTVLFDAPGPRARARHRILTIVGLVLAAAILVVVIQRMGDRGQLEAAKWKPFLTADAWVNYLLLGIWGTVKAAAISISFAAVFGLIFGVGRLSDNRAIRWASSVVVEFFRAVPVLLMMIFSYFTYVQQGIFSSEVAPLAGVVTGLTLYNGAVLAELVRSGVHGLPKGQREAGLSVGLTNGATLRSILLPQALRAMLPALIGQCVVVLKDSALGYQITYQELSTWASNLGSANANNVPAYIVAAILFIVMNFSLTWVAQRIQERISRRGIQTKGTAAPQTAVVATTGATGLNAPPGPQANRHVGDD